MDSEKVITSKGETISIVEVRKLLEVTESLAKTLNHEELVSIMQVYDGVINRLLIENGVC
ncbi:MAG: hypothetical protein AB9836_04945 [Aminipila sp.]